MVILFDIGIVILVILAFIIVFCNAGAVLLEEVYTYIETPALIIFLVANLVFFIINIIAVYGECYSSRKVNLVTCGLYSVGRILRVFVEYIYLNCVFASFYAEFAEAQDPKWASNGTFMTIFAFGGFIGDLLIALFIFALSMLIDSYTVKWLEDMPPILAGIISLVLSVLYFLILQALLGGIYGELYQEAILKVGVFKKFMSEPIVFRIFG